MLTKDTKGIEQKWQNVKYAAKRQLSDTPKAFPSARRTGLSARIFSVSPSLKTVSRCKRHCVPSAFATWRRLQNKVVIKTAERPFFVMDLDNEKSGVSAAFFYYLRISSSACTYSG